MRTWFYYSLLVYICVASCSGKTKDKDTVFLSSGADPVEQVISGNIENTFIDSVTVFIALTDGQGSVELSKKADQTLYIEFENDGYDRLFAEIVIYDPPGNIRFDQIIMPDGTTDGPFSQTLQYDLPASGIYRLSMHENMMAGERWSGTFTVNITLSHLIGKE
ncbi:MAG: hypothetical protein LUE93_03620 [Bacteroides sp.]|nr:hypothetical protein [Bacteroides sp.]